MPCAPCLCVHELPLYNIHKPQLTRGQLPHPTPALAGAFRSREHPFQGQCVSITRRQRAAWHQHGQIAAVCGKQYIPVISHYIQGLPVQEELCPVTRFQKGRIRCKWDSRAEEVLWAAVQLPSQQILSIVSHCYYSARAGENIPGVPSKNLGVRNHPSAEDTSFIRDKQQCKSLRRKIPKAAASAQRAGLGGQCPWISLHTNWASGSAPVPCPPLQHLPAAAGSLSTSFLFIAHHYLTPVSDTS